MKVLVVGNGGREHALGLALSTATPAPTLLFAPGNPGTAQLGRNISTIQATDVAALVELAATEQVDLVIPGPEAALVAGLADALLERNIPCCGPQQKAAQLEASKIFTRDLGARLGLPQPRFHAVNNANDIDEALATWANHTPPVVKANGLAAGKGVSLPDTLEACRAEALRLLEGSLGDAGKTVIFEDRMTGAEASLFYACSGTTVVSLPHARDHKRIGDHDQGPNTGGMGAVSPNPRIDAALQEAVRRGMVVPTLRALLQDGTPFRGFLFVGIMLTPRGPRLLEFNVRWGDPEAQAILPRLQPGEFLRLCQAVATDTLKDFELREDPRPTCAVVLAAHGYPGTPRRGDAIDIDASLHTADRWLIHAGSRHAEGGLITAGGRVATVVARGNSPEEARELAYQGTSLVQFNGMQYRHDIGELGQFDD